MIHQTSILFRRAVMTLLAVVFAISTAWADASLSGSGTADDPYVIGSADDWDIFASNVNSGVTFSGQFVKLTSDITVSTMAGDADHQFAGTFDGGGNTLTLALSDGGEKYCAPFSYVDGATFRNLIVDGTINATVKGDGTHGGFVGISNGATSFENCAFKGSMSSENSTTNSCGGFVGWANAAITFTDCLFAPTAISVSETNCATFNRGNSSILSNCTYTHCYYTSAFGTQQGVLAYSNVNDIPEGAAYTEFKAIDGKTYYYCCLKQDEDDGSYLIQSDFDWTTFVKNIASGETYEGKTIKLTTGITISKMAGDADHQFSGTFDGGGKTLTLALSDGGDRYCAPFRYVNGAKFQNLIVDGVITAERSGDGSHGGFVGFSNGATSFENCAFKGSILGENTKDCGGFVGWAYAAVTFTDCLFAPKEITVGEDYSATFSYYSNSTFTRCCYTTAFGKEQGELAYANESDIPEGASHTELKAVDGETYYYCCLKQDEDDGSYLIQSDYDWTTFVKNIASGETYEGETVKLTNSITISTMAGYNGYPESFFAGTFDGGGHTLTLNLSDGGDIYCAPFSYVKGATFQNLIVDGVITAERYGDGTHGGFVGVSSGETSFDKCIFKGKMLGGKTNSCGGFVGYANAAVTFTDCLFVPTEITVSDEKSATFNRGSSSTYTRCYYTKALGAQQGEFVYATLPEGVSYTEIKAFDGNTYYQCSLSQENDSYLIKSDGDWVVFANNVALGETYKDKTVKLTTDITVSMMAGSSSHQFSGTFDGGGYKLTLNLNDGGNKYCAPFSYANAATFQNLIVDGVITAERSGDGTHGGFVGVSNGETSFDKCIFKGKMLGGNTNSCGGFVGWANAAVTFTDCLFAPTEIAVSEENSATFNRGSSSTYTNCYCTSILGTRQGLFVYANKSDLPDDAVSVTAIDGNTYYYINWREDMSMDAGYKYGAPGFYYVNMPTAGSKSTLTLDGSVVNFNIYDVGGKNGSSFNNANKASELEIKASGYVIILSEINVDNDGLYVYTSNGSELCRVTNSDEVAAPSVSNSEYVKLQFYPGSDNNTAGNLSLSIALGYTVSYNLGGGEWSDGVEYPTFYAISGESIPLNDPVRAGCTFEGWYDNAQFAGDAITEIAKGSTGNKTFYAKWGIIALAQDDDGSYLIQSDDDWAAFVHHISSGETYKDKTVKLTTGITISKMAGDADHQFSGTFNGSGNTLTLNLNDGGKKFCAPFRYVNGATFQNLIVDGTITATISGDGTHGGFVGVSNGATKFYDCAFKGSFYGGNTTSCGGFVGYANAAVTFTDCFFAPTEITVSKKESATFNRGSGSTFTRCYCTKVFGTTQGIFVCANKDDLPNDAFSVAIDGNTYYFLEWPTWLMIDDDYKYGDVEFFYLNMPSSGLRSLSLDGKVGSFTVYDSGGKDGIGSSSNLELSSSFLISASGTHSSEGGTMSVRTSTSGTANYYTSGFSVQSKYIKIGISTADLCMHIYLNYSITYELNDGTMPQGVTNPTSYKSSQTITLNNPVRDGFTFVGWYDNAEFTGDPITEIVKNSTGNKTFYAKWAVTYIITYNPGDGATLLSDKNTYTADDETFTLDEPTKTGYTFGGWFEKEDLSGDPITEIKQGSTGNITLYAKWFKPITETTVAAIPDQEWTGSDIEPALEITDGDYTLQKDVDYTVTYSDNQNTGIASVAIIGIGDYSGEITDVTFNIVAKKIPVSDGLIIYEDQDGKIAKFANGSAEIKITEPITVNSVELARTFTPDAEGNYSRVTMILPFAAKSTEYTGGTFYEFTSVAPDENGKWVASLTKVAGNLAANTPYLFVPSANKLTFNFEKPVELQKTSEVVESAKTEDGWVFKGVYKRQTWGEDNTAPDYFFTSSAKTATNGTEVAAGDFVRIGKNCGLNPMRCYLTYDGDDKTLRKTAFVLPESIEVRLIDEVAAVVEPVTEPENTGDDIKTPVSEILPAASEKVWSFDKTIFIQAQPGTSYRIVDASGRALKVGVTNTDRDEIRLGVRGGIVIVIINGKTFKVSY